MSAEANVHVQNMGGTPMPPQTHGGTGVPPVLEKRVVATLWIRRGSGGGRFPFPNRRAGGFTLLEILLALALVTLVLVAMNSFIFSMGELWGQNSEARLFERHVRAVTRFLEDELRRAVLPPAARQNSTPIAMQEVRPQNGMMENLVTFELPEGSRLFTWPGRELPEVVCSFQARPNEGLVMLWHSRLEKNFETDPPRETVVSPLVTGLTYEYYDAEFSRWSAEPQAKKDQQGQPLTPNRIRLKFTYDRMTRESVVTLPMPTQGLPAF
jgi:prepilin-type N-terminal cleavage/methylation domain-containing protein